MKITIEATPNEIKELLQAIGSSKEQLTELEYDYESGEWISINRK